MPGRAVSVATPEAWARFAALEIPEATLAAWRHEVLEDLRDRLRAGAGPVEWSDWTYVLDLAYPDFDDIAVAWHVGREIAARIPAEGRVIVAEHILNSSQRMKGNLVSKLVAAGFPGKARDFLDLAEALATAGLTGEAPERAAKALEDCATLRRRHRWERAG